MTFLTIVAEHSVQNAGIAGVSMLKNSLILEQSADKVHWTVPDESGIEQHEILTENPPYKFYFLRTKYV